jgi:hypothetical protein
MLDASFRERYYRDANDSGRGRFEHGSDLELLSAAQAGTGAIKD